MIAALAIVRKDLRLLLQDRRALAVLLLMPLIFIAILGASAGKFFVRRSGSLEIRTGLVDLDRSSGSKNFCEVLAGHGAVAVTRFDDLDAAKRSLLDGRSSVLVVVREGFGDRLERADPGTLLGSLTGQHSSLLEAFRVEVEGNSGGRDIDGVIGELVAADLLRLAARHLSPQASTPTTIPAVASPGESTDKADPSGNRVYEVLVPSYTVMFTFFLINFMARSVIGERASGTLDRMRSGPTTIASIVAGKAVPFCIISVIQGVLLFGFGALLFGMSWGTVPQMLGPVILCTSLAATGLGLLTAGLAHSEAQVSAYANLVVITFGGISGCLMPRDWLPDLLQQVSLATPHAWALMAYDELLSTPTPDLWRVCGYCGVLLLFAAGFVLAGWWRVSRSVSSG